MKVDALNQSSKDTEKDITDNSKKQQKKRNNRLYEEGEDRNMNGTKVIDKYNNTDASGPIVPIDESTMRKKKRKHSSTVGDPQLLNNKKLKKSQRKVKVENSGCLEDNNLTNDNEDKGDEKLTEQQAEQMTGKFLRSSFNSANGLETLKTFIKMCNDSKDRDIAAEYLSAGGSILEILRMLDTADKKNTGNITAVFTAISTILVKIMAEYPQYQSSAEEACRHLINSHLSSIHSMLSLQSSAKQRKVVLKSLAAMVSLSNNLARELLAHLTLQPQVLESLVRHTKPTDTQSVRTCFIHFILAFLVEGNVQIIRALLEKQGLLSSIFPELIYDSKDVVNLVLNTVKTYVLENSGISKTIKLHVFSTTVIQNLVRLYNWKGPKSWPKGENRDFMSSPEYLEEKETVTDIIHNFLIVLLTSHRHGIAFHDRTLGTSRAKHNQLVNTVLQSLDRPWEHEKPADLVIQIMSACPDLIKSQFVLLEPYIEPRLSIKWITLMKFVRKIIESVDAEACLKVCSSELNISNLAVAATSLTIPGIILKNAIIPSLSHKSITVRHEATLLLIVMFEQIEKFSLAVRTISKDDADVAKFKHHTIEYILKNVPSLDMVLKAWSLVFMESESTDNVVQADYVPEPTKQEHLDTILNLLHAYTNVCPELLDAAINLGPSELLTALNDLDNIETVELNRIKVKAIQFLLALDPAKFSPQEKIFDETLSFLISLLNEEMSINSSYAKRAIKTLLNTTGLFEGCTDHLDIWIHGFINMVNSNEKGEVANWFVKSIKKTAQHTEKYISSIIEIEESVKEEVALTGGLDDVFNGLMDKVAENSESNTLHMQRRTSLSPLLCCMIRKMNQTPSSSVLSYISYVLVHTLHYQVSPDCLIYLVKSVNGLPVLKYLTNWLKGNQPCRVKKVIPSMSTIHKLSSALLSDTKIQLNEIFNGGTVIKFEYHNEKIMINHALSEYEVMNLLRMTIFYLAQLSVHGILTQTQAENCTIVLTSLLYIAEDISDEKSMFVEKCAKYIFSHPVVLQYFSPLCQKKKDSTKILMIFIIYDICNVLEHLNTKCNVAHLFYHFKNKYFEQLNNMIEKRQKSDKVHNLETVVALFELLQFSAEDLVCVLDKLLKLENDLFLLKDTSQLSFYGYMIPKVLQIMISKRIRAKRTTFSKLGLQSVKYLFGHLLYLKSHNTINIDDWETSLYKYLCNFPYNIAGISVDTFSSLLSTKITSSTVKLISLLIGRNTKFVPILVDHVIKSNDIEKRDVIFPILSNNFSCKWNQEFLQKISRHYQSEIVSYLSDPESSATWIEEHASAICYILEKTFDLVSCEEICTTILQSGDKLDLVSIQYLQILQSLYHRYATLKADSDTPNTDLIQVLLHIVTLTLKKESKNVEKLRVVCRGLIAVVKRFREKKNDATFESLSNNHSWLQFTRFSLKLGLKESKARHQDLPILKTLNILCDIAYKNDSDNQYVRTLFEMATSHSEFINIMLGSSIIKRDLIELLWILIHKQKSIMDSSHVPLYLAAYSATLSETDQFILLILQYYENNGISIYDYRPYLWGNAAAIHYSVKGDINMALWRQPSISQVLSLFEKEIVQNTIKYFPVDRTLKGEELYEANDIYDPAFYLPLLYFLLSENNVVRCNKITQSGALALVFAACGSSQNDVRMLAYTIISRYYMHLEISSSKAKLLWMRLVDAVRYGIISLDSELSNVRLSCLVSTFLARTSLVATQPLNPLYAPLQSFLTAKPALDVKTIPELLQLLHSPDIEHKAHRHWILENIRDGMRTKNDVELAFKCVLFKMLLDFYTCTLSDVETKKLILEVIEATSRIAKASTLLIQGHGLLPWFFEAVKNLQVREVHTIDLIVKIVNNLLKVLPRPKSGIDHGRLILLKIMLHLKSRFSKNINVTSFTLYLNVLQQLIAFKCTRTIVSEQDVIELLNFSKGLLGNVDECEDILLHGCEYVTKTTCSESDTELDVARISLKKMTITWRSQEIK